MNEQTNASTFDVIAPSYAAMASQTVTRDIEALPPDFLSGSSDLCETFTSLYIKFSESQKITDTSRAIVNVIDRRQILDSTRKDLRLLKKIRDFFLYEDNWDGKGAHAPSEEAINEAEEFLRTLPIEKIREPFISLANDGEIVFLWKNDEFHLDLGCYGDGTLSYYGEAKDGRKFFCNADSIEKGLSPEIINLLR